MSICYLCGERLTGRTDRDHVPPKQVYGKSVRRVHNPKLVRLDVHWACNQAYQYDEDYFVTALVPLATDSHAGRAVLDDKTEKYHRGEQVGLMQKVLEEFDQRPSGIILPPGKIAKRLEGVRIGRITWKIVRGLFFIHEGQFLPEDTPRSLELVPVGDRPPDIYFALNDAQNRGRYAAVFDYRYAKFPEARDLYLWALLLWDRIIMIVGHHSPESQVAHREYGISPEVADARSVDLTRIFELARVFRDAIASCDKSLLPASLAQFPLGACGDAALLMGKFLEAHGFGLFDYFLGERDDRSHAWLQQGAVIVDITADQFEDQPEPVIVALHSDWHATFDGQVQHVADFSAYDERSAAELSTAYTAILDFVAADFRPGSSRGGG